MKSLKTIVIFLLMSFLINYVGPVAVCINADAERAEKARPKVSVIVPVYNVEPYLCECLDSVKNQTLRDIEIICVDDGSPDNCGEILDEYAKEDERFIIIHQENKGLPMARQAGMDVARGEYMKHVDSDDYLDLEALEICYNEAQKDDVDILVHGAYAFNEKKQWIYREFPYQLITEQQFKFYTPFVWSHMYKSDFIKQNGINYNGARNYREDQYFNMQCVPLAKNIKTVPNVLYYYRQRPSSMVHSINPIDKSADWFHNVKLVFNQWNDKKHFKKSNAKISFLQWILKMNFWPNNKEICKMFCDTLNSLDPTLLTDKKLISQLTKREREKLNKIVFSENPTLFKKNTHQFRLRRVA